MSRTVSVSACWSDGALCAVGMPGPQTCSMWKNSCRYQVSDFMCWRYVDTLVRQVNSSHELVVHCYCLRSADSHFCTSFLSSLDCVISQDTRHITQKVHNTSVLPRHCQYVSLHALEALSTLQTFDSSRFVCIVWKSNSIYVHCNSIHVHCATSQCSLLLELLEQLHADVVIVHEQTMAIVQVVLADIQHGLCCLSHTSVFPLFCIWNNVYHIACCRFSRGE